MDKPSIIPSKCCCKNWYLVLRRDALSRKRDRTEEKIVSWVRNLQIAPKFAQSFFMQQSSEIKWVYFVRGHYSAISGPKSKFRVKISDPGLGIRNFEPKWRMISDDENIFSKIIKFWSWAFICTRTRPKQLFHLGEPSIWKFLNSQLQIPKVHHLQRVWRFMNSWNRGFPWICKQNSILKLRI